MPQPSAMHVHSCAQSSSQDQGWLVRREQWMAHGQGEAAHRGHTVSLRAPLLLQMTLEESGFLEEPNCRGMPSGK